MNGKSEIRNVPEAFRFLLYFGDSEYRRYVKRSSVVKIDPEIMNGTPCFIGTRVPVRTLLDYLEAGDSLDLFLEDFPAVSRKQAIAFLEEASKRLLSAA